MPNQISRTNESTLAVLVYLCWTLKISNKNPVYEIRSQVLVRYACTRVTSLEPGTAHVPQLTRLTRAFHLTHARTPARKKDTKTTGARTSSRSTRTHSRGATPPR